VHRGAVMFGLRPFMGGSVRIYVALLPQTRVIFVAGGEVEQVEQRELNNE
jgi:hypothetical protein